MLRPLFFLALVGCAAERDPAPDGLDALLHYTFRNFEDPDKLADAIDGLSTWLDTEGRQDSARDGFRTTTLTPDDVADIVTPGLPLDLALGVGAGSLSVHPAEEYSALVLEPDQTFLGPGSYTRYDRAVIDGDEAAFLDGEGTVRTFNDIEKENVGVRIPFEQYKDYTWVHVDDTRRAVVARSWVETSSCNDGGNNCVLQSYAVDIVYASDDRDAVRLTNNWMHLTTSLDGVLSEDQMVGVAVNGIVAIHDHEVSWLDQR